MDHQLSDRIEEMKLRVAGMKIPPAKKNELLYRLKKLRPGLSEKDSSAFLDHSNECECGYCESGYASSDPEPQIVDDPAIKEVYQNFSNPLIPPRIMKKVVPILVIGVGIVLCVIGIKMMKKKRESAE